ncbi:hypothetical protein HPB52_012527 [Rhipicephalus sanguineus]|uniref:HTH CENPB-type domain-containing protein n=1 Tax=Rhipicephalus sanguineus TaxID=34632 RepID=A0A9D4PM99_RHISA|nr:hypothetical protein HPB52_012527 [Rhipicephalus sanguineus]
MVDWVQTVWDDALAPCFSRLSLFSIVFAATWENKLDIIEQVEKGKKQADIAVAYDLSKQTVNTIINAKEAILAKKVSGDLQPKRFRLREALYPDIEEALLMWLRDARSQNIPINGLLLRKHAEQFAVVLNQEQFQCSEGWLNRYGGMESPLSAFPESRPASTALL